MLKSVFKTFVSIVLLFLAQTASASLIYFADDVGNVGSYDDVSAALSPVGNLGGFTISQNIGIAYDPARDRILILDRGTPAVYSMDPLTGTAALLFAPNQTFQGGAVKGNLLYGLDESAQIAVAYDLTTFAQVALSGAALPHMHGMGIDTASGQLVVADRTNVFVINDDGTIGTTLVASAAWSEDLDPLGANFLNVNYGQTVNLIDGVTGAETTWLSAAQTASTGVTQSISGVVVASTMTMGPAVPVPTMTQWGVILLIVAMLLVAYSRRRVTG